MYKSVHHRAGILFRTQDGVDLLVGEGHGQCVFHLLDSLRRGAGHLCDQALGLQGRGSELLQICQLFAHRLTPLSSRGPESGPLSLCTQAAGPNTSASISATSASVATVMPANFAFSSSV